MKKEPIKEIIEKYKNGQTSLKEEQYLLDNSSNLNFPLTNWIISEKENKPKVPEDLNEKLWQSFDQRTKPKNRIIKRTLAAAATIVLFFMLFNKNHEENTQNIWEKQALLMEAKSMLSKTEQNTTQEIIFDSDLITVYIKTK